MVGTLGKGSRWGGWASAGMHVLGSTVSATVVGAAFAYLGHALPMSIRIPAAIAIGVAYGAMEMGFVTLPLPETGRQVPAGWRYRFPEPVTAALYGTLLGPGLATRVASPSYVTLLAVVTFAARPSTGAALLGTYGFTRAVAAVVLARRTRRGVITAISWGYSMAALWRAAGVAFTSLLTGVLLADLFIGFSSESW
jgi:hypothetical protein